MKIEFVSYIDKRLTTENIRSLFDSVSWGGSLSDFQLKLTVKNASHFVLAYDEDTSPCRLVGFARSMDDNIWNANIDCVIVRPDYQRKGIASAMLDKLLEQLGHIQTLTVAPNESENSPLYQKRGFILVEDGCLLQRENF